MFIAAATNIRSVHRDRGDNGRADARCRPSKGRNVNLSAQVEISDVSITINLYVNVKVYFLTARIALSCYMHIPDKYYSSLGYALAKYYLIFAAIVIVIWLIPPSFIDTLNCGKEGPFYFHLGSYSEPCYYPGFENIFSPIHAPYHSLIDSAIFHFRIYQVFF